MSISESSRKDIAAMPPLLRELLEAELAAGNMIVEVGHSFPAPPAGAYFKLAKPLLTHPRKSAAGVSYYDRNGPDYSGEITDASRFYFLLEPARPSEPAPHTESLRATRMDPAGIHSSATTQTTVSGETPLRRFERSMILDFDKWHDGEGYDLNALCEMSPAEKKIIETVLICRGARDWRDIEALACLNTPEARTAIKAAMSNPNPEVRNAVTRCAPDLIPVSMRIASLVQGLETAFFYGGLTQALDQVETFHPPQIIEALLRGVLGRPGEVAVHFAAMLCYIHGQAPEPFDLEQRPFFLQFNTDIRAERESVFRVLCQKIGVDAAIYL